MVQHITSVLSIYSDLDLKWFIGLIKKISQPLKGARDYTSRCHPYWFEKR